LGLTCETNSPGDGVRRFEFTLEYPGGGWSAYSYGSREAWQFLRGYDKGKEEAQRAFRDPVKSAVFVIESVAHLRGMERDLLPLADKLRALVS
jgi:hypothetical protein